MPDRPPSARHGDETVIPFLAVDGAERLVEFLEGAFGGVLEERQDRDDGTIARAQIRLGGSLVLVSDAGANWPAWPARTYLLVPDVDDAYRRALDHGGATLKVPSDVSSGVRTGGILDPFGNQWWLATSPAFHAHDA